MAGLSEDSIPFEIDSFEAYRKMWAYLHGNNFRHKEPSKAIWTPNYTVLDADGTECGHFLIDRGRQTARLFIYRGTRLEEVLGRYPGKQA